MTCFMLSHFSKAVRTTRPGNVLATVRASVQGAAMMSRKLQCRKNLKELKNRMDGIEKKFDPIQYFFHVTAHRNSIEKDGYLKRSIANLRFGSEGSPIDGRLEGVFFCCTLFKEDLPTLSPYGTERICIPVEHFLSGNPRLFYNSYHVVPGNPVNPVPVHYVVLVLVKESDFEFSFCKENLVELPIDNNSFLMIDRSGQRYMYGCFSNQTCYHKFRLYVEVFVVGKVELPESVFWDKVTYSGKSSQ